MTSAPDSTLQDVLDRLAAVDAKLDVLLAAQTQHPNGELLTARQLASRLGVSEAHVYRHQERYGAIRLGEGPRPRLRFPAAPPSLPQHPSRTQRETQRPTAIRTVLRGEWRPIHAPRDGGED